LQGLKTKNDIFAGAKHTFKLITDLLVLKEQDTTPPLVSVV